MNARDLPAAARALMNRLIVRQFLQFATVGVFATAIHYGVLIGLVELAGFAPVVATSFGFVCASATSYTINRATTFKARASRGFVLFVALGAVGLVLNALIMGGLNHAGLPYILAQVFATAVVLLWNFGSARFIVFKPH